MTTTLTERDLARLKGVHPKLVEIIHAAAKDPSCPPFQVIEGVRTLDRQKELVAKGASRTLNSMHIPKSDGFGRAVDLVPLPVNWNDIPSFKKLKASILAAAKQRKLRVRSGADWDENGVVDAEELAAYIKKFGRRPLVDWPHFEIHGV